MSPSTTMDPSDAPERADAGAESSGGASTKPNVGRIEEIQGVVIEAVFPEKLPEINHAITIARPAAAAAEEAPGISTEAGGEVLVCEVQQHLGDDRVRAVAMDTTDGLARGVEVIDTGGPITVPVGEATLGRTSTSWANRSISARSCRRTPSAARSIRTRRASRI